jgi:hypothetical protein
VNARSQCGATLAEAAVALAIVSLTVAGISGALLPAARRMTGDARSLALQRACDRALREARDILKYDGSSLAANEATISVPMPGGSPLAATLRLTVTPQAAGTAIVVTASADGVSGASASTVVAARAPQPGGTFAPAQIVAAPTGAP